MYNIRKYEVVKVGDCFTTKSCGTCTVIAVKGNGTSSSQVTVKFDSTGYVKIARCSELRRGHVRDPYSPTVFGVGYLGEGKYKGDSVADAYNAWYAMMQRAYSGKHYINCTVATEWHDFQVFAEWYYSHYKPDYQLDKDILSDTRQYGPNTCVYVPRSVNSAEAALRHSVKDCPELQQVLDSFLQVVKSNYL